MKRKDLIWVGSSKKELLSFPSSVIDTMGYALHLAQAGERYMDTKTLRGMEGGIIAIRDKAASGTYRVMYTVAMSEIVFVLYAFQKKSTQGIKTPQKEMDLIASRFKQAQDIYRNLLGKK